ncbi:hypothetical protein BSY16_197 [Sinorhizobium sp. RAC02]|nr:hypothetical protein BSY16_197 [Sinorhizobium sp. RAC02]
MGGDMRERLEFVNTNSKELVNFIEILGENGLVFL